MNWGLTFTVFEIVFVVHLFYMIGAFLSAWTYFGVPISMRP